MFSKMSRFRSAEMKSESVALVATTTKIENEIEIENEIMSKRKADYSINGGVKVIERERSAVATIPSKPSLPLSVPPSVPLSVPSSVPLSPSMSPSDAVLMRDVSDTVLLSLTRLLDMECRALSGCDADTYMQHITSTYGAQNHNNT